MLGLALGKCPVSIFLFLGMLFLFVNCNDLCDSKTLRCPYGQKCFQYTRKSECPPHSHSVGRLSCKDAPTRNICLDAKNICGASKNYDDAPWNKNYSGIKAGPSPSKQCSKTYAGDGTPCKRHGQCQPVPGGLALCCNQHCVHVHNQPCVRDFFKSDDQLCSDRELLELSHPMNANSACGVPGKGTVDAFFLSRDRLSASSSTTTAATQTNGSIGGVPTTPKQVCWQVQIITHKDQFDGTLLTSTHGGTIIGSRTILTSAMTVYNFFNDSFAEVIPAQNITVQIGPLSSDVNEADNCTEEFAVATVIPHEHFSFELLDNDIALLTLLRPIDLENKPCACALCLSKRVPRTGELCVISGMGYDGNDYVADNTVFPFQYVPVEIRQQTDDLDQCFHYTNQANQSTNMDLFICANKVSGQSFCAGDYGGPLFCLDTDREQFYQAGIQSMSVVDPECASVVGSQYTKLSKYVHWITQRAPRDDVIML